jgi:hypothetical protein
MVLLERLAATKHSRKQGRTIENFLTKCMSATPKMGVHLVVIGVHPLHSPPFVKVCFTPKHTFFWPHGPLHSTFSREPNVTAMAH